MFTTANIITITRIILIPVFILTMLQVPEDENYRYVTLVIFVVITFGDALDGYLARRLKEETTVGRYIDPIADKLLIDAACIVLAHEWWEPTPLPRIVAVVIVSRDIFIVLGTAMFFFITGKFMKIQPTILGKLTTFAQVVMVTATLLSAPPLPHYVLYTLWGVTVILTAVSGIHYLSIGISKLGTPGNERMSP